MGILNMFIGYCLFAIVAYAFYQLSVFLLQQIDASNDMENVGLATFVITMTLAGTSALLRFDSTHKREPVRVMHERTYQ